MNGTTPESTVRELDCRANDGIEVRLLWNSLTNCVSVSVDDTRVGECFAFDVAGSDAIDAFHHPYVYANHDQSGSRNRRVSSIRPKTEQRRSPR